MPDKKRLLDYLAPELRARLSARWREQAVEAGRVIVREGEESAEVFFVLSGALFACSVSEGGKEVVFDRFGPGDCVGEFSAIDGAPRSSDVKVQSDARLGVMTRAEFNAFFDAEPEFARDLVEYLVAKLRVSVENFTHLRTEKVEDRIARRLYEIGLEHREGEADRVFIRRPPTQETIAREANAYREAVVGVMTRLKEAGIATREGRALVILSLAKLERWRSEG
ncbi:MAG: Crp/Fnr family transcriptional regulator [Pseudomonadota bacterium]